MSRPPKPNQGQQRHGLYALRGALKAVQPERQERWLDELGETGQALRDWRAALISDLGGQDAVSAQQRAMVDLAAKTYLMLESVDRYLLEQPSLVNKSRRQLFPVVLQRQQLADSLARCLERLGLDRREKRVVSLDEYLAEKGSESANSGG